MASIEKRNQMFNENVGLVGFTIKKYYGNMNNIYGPYEIQDFYQIGCLGLLKAIDRYDPSKSEFSTFAVIGILGEISMELRDKVNIIKFPRKAVNIYYKICKLLKNEEMQPEDINAQNIANKFDIDESIAQLAIECYNHKITHLEKPYSIGKEGDTASLKDMVSDEKINVEEEAIKKLELDFYLNQVNKRDREIITLSLKGVKQREIAKKFKISQVQVSRIINKSISLFENIRNEEAMVI